MPEKRFLDSNESFRLDFRTPLARPDLQRSLSYPGMTLEYTRVTAAAEYGFAWTGHHHYLALHDLVMERGDMNVEGMPTTPGGDIRGTMTYLPAGRSLKGWSKTTGRQNSFTILHFDPSMLSEETGRILGDESTVPLIYFDDPQLLSTMKKLDAIVSEGLDHPAIYVETAALMAALELARLQTQSRTLSERTGRLSRAQETLLRDYIEDHLAKDITLDELSQLVQFSRFHMARRFKATFGVPPHRYVLDRRIEMAKRLLKETPLPIAEIATVIGFSSAGLFIRSFRAAMGVTPLAYRRG